MTLLLRFGKGWRRKVPDSRCTRIGGSIRKDSGQEQQNARHRSDAWKISLFDIYCFLSYKFRYANLDIGAAGIFGNNL